MKDLTVNFKIDESGILKEAQDNLTKHVKHTATRIVENLFASKNERASSYFRGDADSGFLYDEISNLIQDKALDEKWKKYAEEYIEHNFKKHLEEALDKMMTHKANKIAFSKEKMDECCNTDS